MAGDIGGDAEPGSSPGGSTRSGGTVWRRGTSTAYVESPDRAVVLDLDHPDLPPYVFEGSGARIWAGLDGVRSEDELVADLAEAFEAPTEVVGPDLRRFIDRLQELGLVVRADGV